MFKRPESTAANDYFVPAKRAKFNANQRNYSRDDKARERETRKDKNAAQYDDLWGDDFAEEDIEEMDLVASQACLQEGNALENSRLFDNGLHSARSNLPEEADAATTAACRETSQLQLPPSSEKSNFWARRNIQCTSRDSQDITDINYSQFRNRLIDREDHNSTFQRRTNLVVPDDKELERLKNENKKLLNNFITKDGENVFLRQQLQQTQLRVENEKSEKTRIIEEQANLHKLEINKICKEKEQLKTQLELQNLEIGKLLERCKLLESGNIKLKEPQSLHVNTSLDKSKCNASMNWFANTSRNPMKVKEISVQTDTSAKSDYELKTRNTYFPLARISELMFGVSVMEKPIIDVKVIEKTGRRNLPILQEEESFRIFENPDLVKPVITYVDGKRLTTEFVLREIATIGRKTDAEIESESCIPIINKVVLITRELMLNITTALQTIFQAMRNDDIRDMNDLYFSTIYEDYNICIKSECEAEAWHEGECGIEARRLFGVLSHISLESLYLSNYLAGKSFLCTRNDECYNHYLHEMTRYNAWPKKGHEFEVFEMILECVTLIGNVRRSHQFTGLINAIVKVLCNVQEKVGYCEKGLEYVCLIFKEVVFSRPLPLCYISLTHFIMVFSRSSTFLSKMCNNSESVAIKNWKGSLHFTPNACVLQILIAQMEHFHPDFITTVKITHPLILSVQYILQTNNNLLRAEKSESCNCYKKLLQFTINMLRKCSESKLDIIDRTEWQDPSCMSNKFYTLKRIDYKDNTYQSQYDIQNIEKYTTKAYPEKLDRNFWSDVKKIQHIILREGIRFLYHLAICDPNFVIRSPDIEDSFHLFIRNIPFFNDITLYENEREALDRIKATFIIDKGVQNESESHYKNVHVNQLDTTHFKKKIIPGTRNHVSLENFDRIHMTIKALYSSETRYCGD